MASHDSSNGNNTNYNSNINIGNISSNSSTLPISSHNENTCGYDENLFLSPPADYLRCGICLLVLQNPVQIIDCGHKYCRKCFQQYQAAANQNNEPLQCPIDKKVVDVTRMFEDIALKRAVGSLQVRCQHVDKGCEWTGELSEFQTHTVNCRYQCQCDKQGDTAEMAKMVQKMSERVDKLESSMLEKDKEISHMKFNLQEMTKKFDTKLIEVEGMKKVMKDMKIENENFRSEIQRSQQVQEQSDSQRERQVTDALKTISELVKKVEEMKSKNSELQSEIDEGNQMEETKRKSSTERITALEQKIEILEEKMKITILNREQISAACANPALQQMRPSPQSHCSKMMMQARNDKDGDFVVISSENHILFKKHSTVVLPDGGITRGSKMYYEVDIITKRRNWLCVGWATKEFLTSESYHVGYDEHSYCYEVSLSNSYRVHTSNVGCAKISEEPWGKPLLKSGRNLIGAALDMIKGEMSFSLNGQWNHPMGVALQGIDISKTFFPAISYNGEVQVNFGAKNFVHGPPDDSYTTITNNL